MMPRRHGVDIEDLLVRVRDLLAFWMAVWLERPLVDRYLADLAMLQRRRYISTVSCRRMWSRVLSCSLRTIYGVYICIYIYMREVYVVKAGQGDAKRGEGKIRLRRNHCLAESRGG